MRGIQPCFYYLLFCIILINLEVILCTNCEFCKKDFKVVGRHQWRCLARITNRDEQQLHPVTQEQSIANVNDEIIGDSENVCNDYDPHEKDKDEYNFRCYCGREFTSLRGLNTHRRCCYVENIIDIKDIFIDNEEEQLDDVYEVDDVDKITKKVIKKGVLLPKNSTQWKQANDFFKENLQPDKEIQDIDSEILNLQKMIYNFFLNSYGNVKNYESNIYPIEYKKSL